jgi:hypothetical protein
MAVSFKGAHFPKDIIPMGVRWEDVSQVLKCYSRSLNFSQFVEGAFPLFRSGFQ